MDDALGSRVAAVAALGEPTRRRLYAHVARQTEPVSRDEVAAASRIPRATVAFHLDKLAAEGLLVTSYERRTSRAGPGAGRPAKLYRRSELQVAVSLPERHYELAALLMAGALDDPGAASLADRARTAGAEFARGGGGVHALLERYGFEPDEDGGEVVLRNCPFHLLAQAHPELVCGMALGLVEGMLTGETGFAARLDPGPGRCCVRLAGTS